MKHFLTCIFLLSLLYHASSRVKKDIANITEHIKEDNITEKTEKPEKTAKANSSQKTEQEPVTEKQAENSTVAAKPDAQKDSFQLEIQYLTDHVKLINQKIELLKELRALYVESNQTVPLISLDALNDLSIDSLSSPGLPFAYSPAQPRYYEPAPVAKRPAEESKERYDYLMTRLYKKYTLNFDHRIKEMLYIPTKATQRASDEPATSSLIVFLTYQDELVLYNLNGHFLHRFQAGHKVKTMNVNTFQDDLFVATLGSDNTVRVHSITTNRIKIEPNPPTEEKPTKKSYGSNKFMMEYSTTLNCTFDLENNRLLTTDEDFQGLQDRQERSYNTLSFILGKTTKFFAVGDQEGNLVLFERSGRYKGQFKFPDGKLLSIQKHHPNPLFATDKAVGFFNPNLMEITNPYCDPPGERIIKLEQDQFSTTSFYVLLESGDVLFYEIKQSGCKVVAKRSIQPSENDNPDHFSVHYAKSFLLMQSNRHSPNILAHNISDAQFADYQDIDYHSISTLPKADHDDVVKSDYITQRSSFSSSSIGSYFEFKNGTSVFVLHDISIPPKPSSDWLSNFRLPIVFIAVLLAIGYQFWNKKKKRSDDEVMETLNKFNMQEIRAGRKGLGGKEMDSLKESLDSLTKQTSRMQEDLGNLSSKALSQMRPSGRGGRDYGEDDIQEISTKKFI